MNNSFGILVDINTSLRSNHENNLRFFSSWSFGDVCFLFLPRLYIKYLIAHLCVCRWQNNVFKLRRWYKCKSTFYCTQYLLKGICVPISNASLRLLLLKKLTWLLLGNGMKIKSKYSQHDIEGLSFFLLGIF